MDYLGDKLNSFTSEAVTGISELKRKHQQKRQQQQQAQATQPATTSNNDETALEFTPIKQAANQQSLLLSTSESRPPPAPTGVYGFDLSRIQAGPLSAGVPFGGDSPPRYSTTKPPTVGFNFKSTSDQTQQQQHHPQATAPREDDPSPSKSTRKDDDDEVSRLSLYEGDTWSRMWFQRVMLLTLIRLLLFIRKVYEDFFAFKRYRTLGLVGHCLISAATLFLPTIVFTIYRIARYLQIALPSVRVKLQTPANSSEQQQQQQPIRSARDLEDAQSRRALMSSPSESIQQQLEQKPSNNTDQPSPAGEEDGLATARQTPTNIAEEFHDTQSEGQIQLDSSQVQRTESPLTKTSQPALESGRKSQEPRLESVDVNKLGNIPDKQNTRIFLGVSEQLLHGVLFIFWQLKRQVDIVGYLVERSCLWRRPKETEKQQLGRLRFSGDGLEWFQDFYAAFLAILVQVYTLGAHWSYHEASRNATTNATRAAQLKPTDLLPTQSNPLGAQSDLPEGTVSGLARAGSAILSSTVADLNSGTDLLIMSEIVVSCMVVTSLLVAVRRQDDGPLTLGLSMMGWGSIFASRIIIIALAFVHIGWLVMLPLVVSHVIMISAWIYKIALDSHNGKACESEEHKWAPPPLETSEGTSTKQHDNSHTDGHIAGEPITSNWSMVEHLTLICQVVTLFAIPSLFYWPIMFNLKLNARPFKYLALIMTENFLLIASVWYQISSTSSSSASVAQWYLLGTVGACSIAGFIFISLYVACKPDLTEYFARADELINQAEKSGIYYEFCSRIFKMPDLMRHEFTRLMNQQEHTFIDHNDAQSPKH